MKTYLKFLKSKSSGWRRAEISEERWEVFMIYTGHLVLQDVMMGWKYSSNWEDKGTQNLGSQSDRLKELGGGVRIILGYPFN
jgi:hypothetical protein